MISSLGRCVGRTCSRLLSWCRHFAQRCAEDFLFKLKLRGERKPRACCLYLFNGTTCTNQVPLGPIRYHLDQSGTTCTNQVPLGPIRYHSYQSGTTWTNQVPLGPIRYHSYQSGTTCTNQIPLVPTRHHLY